MKINTYKVYFKNAWGKEEVVRVRGDTTTLDNRIYQLKKYRNVEILDVEILEEVEQLELFNND